MMYKKNHSSIFKYFTPLMYCFREINKPVIHQKKHAIPRLYACLYSTEHRIYLKQLLSIKQKSVKSKKCHN